MVAAVLAVFGAFKLRCRIPEARHWPSSPITIVWSRLVVVVVVEAEAIRRWRVEEDYHYCH